MDGRQIFLESDGLKLEALFYEGERQKGVVITHPHPLYGGNMYNPVVEALATAYRQQGWSCLCFNFRGTGNSQGRFDNGKAETRDVQTSMDYLKAAGYGLLHLAGYSFGAWVNALWATRNNSSPIPLVMVSPPVAFLSFAEVEKLPGLGLVIAGSRDEIAPADGIKNLLAGWNPAAEMLILEKADHFYNGYLAEITRAVNNWLGD